jgi:hypothetical protein
MSVPQPAERTFTAKHVLVVDTCVVHRQSDKTFYYEVHLAPDAEPGAHRTVLVTRDEAAYQFALALEGKDARVNASWHAARQGSRRYAVLDTLEAGVL